MILDFVNEADRYRGQFVEFYMDTGAWRRFKTPHKLTWKKLRFNRLNRSSVPKKRGIYAFTVEHTPTKFPHHGYVLYMGISGDTSAANLRERYGQYLRDQQTGKGRPAVRYMLQKWAKDLFFSYCALPSNSINLATLETALLGALDPPCNKEDFPADISALRRARFR